MRQQQQFMFFGVLSVLALGSALPASALSDAMEDVQYQPPLVQYNAGVALYGIQCNDPRDLYVTGSAMPVCLYPDTYEMLLNRGVSLSLPPTPESLVREVIESTIAMYDSDPDGAFAEINSMMSIKPEYPVISDPDGYIVAHGANHDLVGTLVTSIVTLDRPLDAILSDLQEGEAWMEYNFYNPATGTDQHKRTLAVLHDGYVFSSGYYASSESIVRGVVDETIALYDSDPDGAFATITAMMSTYPSYPFVINSDGIVVAHGSNPDRIGANSALIAATGKPVDAIVSELQMGEMWVGYTFNNPATGTDQHKRSLIVLHGGYIFGSGYYVASDDAVTDTASLLELTSEEEAWLEENGAVRVAFDPDWFPIEYADEEGNLAGATLQYAAEFSRLTGADFAGITAPASWNDTLAMMQNGNADVIFMIVNTPEWHEYLDFTTAHYTVETSIVTFDDRQATLDDEDLSLVTISGYIIDVWLDENYPDVEYRSVDSFADGFELMKNGEANAFAATWQVVRAHAEDAGITVYDAGPTGHQYDLAIGYSNQNPVLGSILQKAVDAIPASQVERWWNDAAQ